MRDFRATGHMAVPDAAWRGLGNLFTGFSLDDAETKAEIARLYRATGYLADPHSAIGIAAARAAGPRDGAPIIAMATAHPAKFPEAMEAATGQASPLPAHLADLFQREEHYQVLPNDPAAVAGALRALVGRNR